MLKWLIAIIISFVNIWILTAITTNPIGISNWNIDLQRFNYPVKSEVAWRSEGWGETSFGPYGIIDLENIDQLEGKNKIFIWGDSFIEALQVNDEHKFHSILNEKFRKTNSRNIAVNMGASGQSLPFYFFQIPKYEQLLGNAYHHYIFISSNDINPTIISRGKENPHIVIDKNIEYVKGNRKPYSTTEMNIRSFIDHFNLQFLKIILNNLSLRNIVNHLRFKPGPVKKTLDDQEEPAEFSDQDLSLILERLVLSFSQQTQSPITFIFVSPSLEIINNNVEMVNSKNKIIKKFRQACINNNIEFIDGNKIFEEKFKHTKILPIGFPNRYLLNGHFNEHGHKVLADIIFTHIKR